MAGITEFLISSNRLFIYFATFLCLPSVALYIGQIVTIFRHKKFHNSFYTLFALRGITHLLYVLDSYYGYRMPTLFGDTLLPFYSALPNFMLAMFNFLSNFTFQADNLATLLILINRMTAIGMPIKHAKIWKYLIVPSGLFIFVVPTLLNYQIFAMDAVIIITPYSNDTISFILYENQNGTILADALVVNLSAAFIFLFLCIFINILTLFLYKRQKQSVILASQNGGDKKIERKLLAYSVATFIGHLLNAFLILSIYRTPVNDPMLMAALCTQYPWMMDTTTVVVSSWLLLWASDSFRAQFLEDILPKRFRAQRNTTVAVKVSNIVMVRTNTTKNNNNVAPMNLMK